MHSEHIGPSSTVIRITLPIRENLHIRSSNSSQCYFLLESKSSVRYLLRRQDCGLLFSLEETVFFYFCSLKLKRILERSQSFSL